MRMSETWSSWRMESSWRQYWPTVSEWVSVWVSEWASEWVSGWVCEWVDEWVSGWVSVSECVSECVGGEWVCVCECVREWISSSQLVGIHCLSLSCVEQSRAGRHYYSCYQLPSPLSRTPPGDAHEQHWGRNPLLSSSHSHHANVKSSWNSSQAVTVSQILLRQLCPHRRRSNTVFRMFNLPVS